MDEILGSYSVEQRLEQVSNLLREAEKVVRGDVAQRGSVAPERVHELGHDRGEVDDDDLAADGEQGGRRAVPTREGSVRRENSTATRGCHRDGSG